MSQIFEYVTFCQLFDYMCENNLLTIEQFGFRRGHSTELAAIQLVDRLTKQMDLGNVPTNIYIDLSKAFDTLDHSILLDKLSYYGICGVENLKLRTYLSNRHQYVEYNGSKSESKSISIGVPQGSILRPLLFTTINLLTYALVLFVFVDFYMLKNILKNYNFIKTICVIVT